MVKCDTGQGHFSKLVCKDAMNEPPPVIEKVITPNTGILEYPIMLCSNTKTPHHNNVIRLSRITNSVISAHVL